MRIDPLSDGRNCATTISKEVLQVRGIATKGPIIRQMRTVNTDANTGWIIEPSFTRLSCFATAATARIGKQTAVMVSPTIARTVLLPACAPRSGGKIRLPAPKNMENSMKPIVIVCRNPSFCIIASS